MQCSRIRKNSDIHSPMMDERRTLLDDLALKPLQRLEPPLKNKTLQRLIIVWPRPRIGVCRMFYKI